MKKVFYFIFFLNTLLGGVFTDIGAQNNFSPEKLKEHVKVLSSDDMDGRAPNTKGIEKARKYIENKLFEAGLIPLKDDTFRQSFGYRTTPNLWVEMENLIGVIPGKNTNLKNEAIVINTSYDHRGYELIQGLKLVYNGANYHASAVAGILELAKYFSNEENLPERTLIFLFTDGNYHSNRGIIHFFENSHLLDYEIKMGINLRGIGNYDADTGINLFGIKTIEQGKEMGLHFAEHHALKVDQYDDRMVCGAETWYFGHFGFPAVLINTLNYDFGNTTEDTYDKLNYDGIAQILDYTVDLIKTFASMDVIVATEKLNPADYPFDQADLPVPRKKFHYGLVMNLGSGYQIYSDKFFRSKSRFNFGIGVKTHFHFTNSISIQPEILYDRNSGRWDEGMFRRNSITVPLNLQWDFSGKNNQSRLFLIGGAYYRYNFSGKMEGEDLDFDLVFERDEWGINFGIGFEDYDIYQLSWTMRRGMSDMIKGTTSIRDVNSLLTIALKFP
ncbi:MAG: M28 family peptidase [Saprospirales bacterium]|nr:MAG: M28 family peptidase [Saprospirales bacterium]